MTFTHRHPNTYAEAERFLWHAINWLRKKSYLHAKTSAEWRDLEHAGILIYLAIQRVQKEQLPQLVKTVGQEEEES